MYLRVSKYDLRYRTADGQYTRDEWTSVSDIGRRFSGQVLSSERYLASERAYIAFALSLFASLQEATASVVAIEGTQRDWSDACAHAKQCDLDHMVTAKIPRVGEQLSVEALADLTRACLRERVWAKVELDESCVLSFGYDFYVYAGGKNVKRSHERAALRLGLFAERLKRFPF